MIRPVHCILVASLLACEHSESFVPVLPVVDGLAPADDLQLTYNSDQDYWPTWTADGQAILYAFVDPNDVQHRCLGLIRPDGGTRMWEMCHRDAVYRDSSSSFGGYALDARGQLLYTEAVGRAITGFVIPVQAAPVEVTLWLADTTRPFTRTALLTFPLHVDGIAISWLADIAWTGPDTFIALGQQAIVQGHCPATPLSPAPICEFSDTVFGSQDIGDAGAVVRGTINGGHVTLHVVAGTNGATGYSLAQDGSSIVFTMKDDAHLYSIPIAGGSPSIAGPATPAFRPGYQLLGIACKLSTCIVAADSVIFARTAVPRRNPELRSGTRELWRVSLTSNDASPIGSYAPVVSALAASPTNNDLVVQVGGGWGHLQTYAGSGPSDLHLLHLIVK
jgi:hypothetical protein